jgi:hypothetical protein
MVKRMQTALNSPIGQRLDEPPAPSARTWPLLGAATLAAAVPALWLGTVARGLGRAVVSGGPTAPQDVLTLLAALVGLALLAWLLLAVLAEAAANVPGRAGHLANRLARRVTPTLVRRGVALALGAGLAGLGTAPLAAADGPPDPGFGPARGPDPGWPTATAPPRPDTTNRRPDTTSPRPDTTSPRSPAPPWSPPIPGATTSPGVPGPIPASADPPAVPTPGWVPAAPTVRRQPSTDLLSRAPRAAAPEDEVVVHRGDSLWSIAARRLGPGASDAEVAAAWPRWYAANRAVIGPDPDLVLPGQRLRVPGGGDDA